MTSKIMLIGEAPGRVEDEDGIPFVGDSGHILRHTFKDHGFDIGRSAFITNVVKCRPEGNRTPTKEECKVCAEQWLEQELKNIMPEAIVMLGRVAQRTILPYAAINNGGKIESEGIMCYYLHHPSYWLRMGGDSYVQERVAPKLDEWIEDWRKKKWN